MNVDPNPEIKAFRRAVKYYHPRTDTELARSYLRSLVGLLISFTTASREKNHANCAPHEVWTSLLRSSYTPPLPSLMALVVLSMGLVGCKTVKEIGEAAGKATEQAAERAEDPVKLTEEGREVEALPLGSELSNHVEDYTDCNRVTTLSEEESLKLLEIKEHFRNEAATAGGDVVVMTEMQDRRAEADVFDCE